MTMDPLLPDKRPPPMQPLSIRGKDSMGHVYTDLTYEGAPVIQSVVKGSFLAQEIEISELESLGCPLDEARKIVGRGYIEEYRQHLLDGLPQPAAEALLCAMIGQDPAISPDLHEKIALSPTEGGTGGVYFLKNFRGEKTFVFKPEDEEPFMPSWPRRGVIDVDSSGDIDYPVRLSIKKGRGVGNELLAAKIMADEFKLDVPSIFYVSPKLRVSRIGSLSRGVGEGLAQKKGGSLQEFKPGFLGSSIRDMSAMHRTFRGLYEGFESSMRVAERIAIADCVCGNCDRNSGNILYSQATKKIYPIDHSLCFPDGLSLDGFLRRGDFVNETDFRLRVPMEDAISEETRELCHHLDSAEIEETMRDAGASFGAIQEMHMRISFLKIAIEVLPGVDLARVISFYNEEVDEGMGSAPSLILESARRAGELHKEGDSFPQFLENFQKEARVLLREFPEGLPKRSREKLPRFS